jgi:hypothetical protein
MKHPLLFSLFLILIFPFWGQTITLTTQADPKDPRNIDLLALVGAAFLENGYEAVVRQALADQGLVDANEGRTDGELGRPIGLEASYPDLVMVAEPVQSTAMVGVALASKQYQLKGLEDVIAQGLVLVTVRESPAADPSMNPPADLPAQPRAGSGRYLMASSYEEALSMVLSGRANILIASDLALKPFLSRPEYAGLTVVGTLYSSGSYLYLNRKWESLAPGLARTLARMRGK